MRIIGGRDYYDSALAWGHDETIVLVREKDKRLSDKEANTIGLYSKALNVPVSRNSSNRIRCFGRTVIVGNICYRGVTTWVRSSVEHFWSIDKWRQFAEKYDISHSVRERRFWNPRAMHDEDFQPTEISKALRDFMVANRISIIVNDPITYDSRYHRDEWMINPDCLKDIGFAKVLDPYTCFQELDMWVSGVLGMPANQMIEVSNEIKVSKHGFDEFSFRKSKEQS